MSFPDSDGISNLKFGVSSTGGWLYIDANERAEERRYTAADEGRQFSDSPSSFSTSYRLLCNGGLFVNIDNEIVQEIDVTMRIPVVVDSQSLYTSSTPSGMWLPFYDSS